MENCMHCNEVITKSFCPNCGQKKYKRIDRKYILDELKYTLLHTNKGLGYSVKNVLRNPGKTAREFIDGNRVNHYKPILLIFVLSGISAFISYKVLGMNELMNTYYGSKQMNSKLMNDVMTMMSSYSSFVMLLLAPLFALTTKIAFRKWGHNYYEHVVMNAFILSFFTLVLIILAYPLMFYFKHRSVETVMQISFYSLLCVPVILVFFFKGFYHEKSLKSIILRVVFVMLLTLLGYVLLIIIGTLIFAIVVGVSKNPKALEYVKPK